MQSYSGEYKLSELTDTIISGFYTVYNTLGYGFLEKVYENALIVELTKRGMSAVAQSPIKVYYNETLVGEYFADILVNSSVIIEIKAVKGLNAEHEAQLLNYLKATSMEVGLLLNVGPEPQVKRKAFDNANKGVSSDADQS